MGTKLVSAVKALRASFPAQRQGDCGVYSFYYAAHLIQQMYGTAGATVLSVDPPRKRYLPYSSAEHIADGSPTDRLPFNNAALTPRDRHTLGTSIRKFAKDSFQSAQGEVFSQGEMQAVIDRFGYGSAVSVTADDGGRQAFISDALRADQPVLIPYWSDDFGYPCATDKEPGAHWSVIFDESATDYLYVNPWFPAKEISAPIATFLASNSNVDDSLYDPVWAKGPTGPSPGGIVDIGSWRTGTSYTKTAHATVPKGLEDTHRPLYPGTRTQALKNLLFSLFASDEQLKAMAPPPIPRRGK